MAEQQRQHREEVTAGNRQRRRKYLQGPEVSSDDQRLPLLRQR